jgi:hypothetical protein
VRKLDAQHGGLERVEAAVEADLFVMIFGRAAVDAQTPEPRGNRVVVCSQKSGLARRAQIFRRVETEAAYSAHRARLTATVVCADGLRRVFDDGKIVLRRDAQNLVHLRALAVEMHGHDGARALVDRIFQLRRVDVVRVRLDVNEARAGAGARDCARGGEECEGRCHNLVALFDVEREQREQKRVRA